MDDPALSEEGLALVRHYGCSGCHEIKGLESEGRIGTELTQEGSKPVERLDFALFTHQAEGEGWYNHKGFFERKLKDPAFFDQGKVRSHLEQLRMPNFMLSDQEITALTTFLMGSVQSTFPVTYRFEPEDARADVQEGWWLIQRYNCNGCHQIRPGDVTSLMNVPRYRDPEWVEQLPPQLYTEGARVQPDWLVRFLTNPALSETNADRNGVRQYLEARMPTFYLSERQVGKVMRFFMARSSQPYPFIPEQIEPLTAEEQNLARELFTGRAAPCMKCHMTGDPVQDRNATAPNFLIASERLKSEWTYRWMLEPAKIAPGTAMPSELFRQEGDRWVFNGTLPPVFNSYERDHARLLVRYMFLITPAEVQRLRAASVQ
jgi:mono/diheme cytochrome c family protein